MIAIFDLDDTIYNLMEPFERTHEDFYASMTDAPCEELFRMSRIYSDEAFYMEAKGLISRKEEFAYRSRKTYADVGIAVDDEAAESFEARYRYYQKHIHIPRGMVKILEELKDRGILTAVLSNGKHKSQQAKVDALGLTAYILQERIFFSEDLSAPKPDVRAFEEVIEALFHQAALSGQTFNRNDIYYIGDSFEVDIEGARAAGLNCIWFNHRKRKAASEKIKPDYEVHSPDELAKVLNEI